MLGVLCTDMNKTLVVSLIATVLVLGGAALYFSLGKTVKPVETTPAPQTESSPANIVGGETDEHGCKGSAGYSWCELKQKCLRIREEPCVSRADDTESIKAEIKQLIVVKNKISPDSVVIEINKVEGNYAYGAANPPVPGPGGGMWFAAKVNGKWTLIWDGNGGILCKDFTPYPDFPKDMLSECYDDSLGKVVTR